jgi:hypothetical protein
MLLACVGWTTCSSSTSRIAGMMKGQHTQPIHPGGLILNLSVFGGNAKLSPHPLLALMQKCVCELLFYPSWDLRTCYLPLLNRLYFALHM